MATTQRYYSPLSAMWDSEEQLGRWLPIDTPPQVSRIDKSDAEAVREDISRWCDRPDGGIGNYTIFMEASDECMAVYKASNDDVLAVSWRPLPEDALGSIALSLAVAARNRDLSGVRGGDILGSGRAIVHLDWAPVSFLSINERLDAMVHPKRLFTALADLHSCGLVHGGINERWLRPNSRDHLLHGVGLAPIYAAWRRQQDLRIGLLAGDPRFSCPNDLLGGEPGPASDRFALAATICAALRIQTQATGDRETTPWRLPIAGTRSFLRRMRVRPADWTAGLQVNEATTARILEALDTSTESKPRGLSQTDPGSKPIETRATSENPERPAGDTGTGSGDILNPARKPAGNPPGDGESLPPAPPGRVPFVGALVPSLIGGLITGLAVIAFLLIAGARGSGDPPAAAAISALPPVDGRQFCDGDNLEFRDGRCQPRPGYHVTRREAPDSGRPVQAPATDPNAGNPLQPAPNPTPASDPATCADKGSKTFGFSTETLTLTDTEKAAAEAFLLACGPGPVSAELTVKRSESTSLTARPYQRALEDIVRGLVGRAGSQSVSWRVGEGDGKRKLVVTCCKNGR